MSSLIIISFDVLNNLQFCSPIYEKTIFEITYKHLINDSRLEKIELIS